MTTIILCGGSGTRLWPLSRKLMPKQFNRFIHGVSLFESTVERNRADSSGFLIASNADQAFLAAGQLADAGVSDYRLLVEPVGRNTAPAIALACLMLPPQELVLVVPSDHVIRNADAYSLILAEAKALASGGALVTFGIHAAYPETGFGYIETDGNKVLSFREKPDAETAHKYVASGKYHWNSGMFCFKAGIFLAELQKHAPEVYSAALKAFDAASGDGHQEDAFNSEAVPELQRLEPSLADMQAIPSISIDYAVMEKSDNVRCVACPADLGWSDLGSHDALYELLAAEKADEAGNTSAGKEEVLQINSKGSLIVSSRQTTLIDVENLLIVDSPDALLIAKRGSSQKVKDAVEQLAARGSELVNVFPTVERPWGTYTVLYEREGYKVKRITVRPGQRLSLQRHKHREEHWTVVEGRPVIQVGEESREYKVGDTVFIPKTAIHRLQNSGSEPVAIIETQLGTYLGEDDIERLQDDYKRA